jgi:uncharacterized protein (DUF1330 family)
MPTYVVMIRDHMRDPVEFEQYAQGARDAREGHDFDVLAFYGASQTLEGAPADGVVILSFANRDAAIEWYESPKYAAAREHRYKSADYRMVIVEGV